MQHTPMNDRELRILEYALCFLNANWDDYTEEDLLDVEQEEVQRLAEKYIGLRQQVLHSNQEQDEEP